MTAQAEVLGNFFCKCPQFWKKVNINKWLQVGITKFRLEIGFFFSLIVKKENAMSGDAHLWQIIVLTWLKGFLQVQPEVNGLLNKELLLLRIC